MSNCPYNDCALSADLANLANFSLLVDDRATPRRPLSYSDFAEDGDTDWGKLITSIVGAGTGVYTAITTNEQKSEAQRQAYDLEKAKLDAAAATRAAAAAGILPPAVSSALGSNATLIIAGVGVAVIAAAVLLGRKKGR